MRWYVWDLHVSARTFPDNFSDTFLDSTQQDALEEQVRKATAHERSQQGLSGSPSSPFRRLSSVFAESAAQPDVSEEDHLEPYQQFDSGFEHLRALGHDARIARRIATHVYGINRMGGSAELVCLFCSSSFLRMCK